MGFPRFKLLILAFFTESAALITAVLLAVYFDINLLPLTKNLYRDILIGTLGASLPFALFVFTLSKRAEKLPVLGSLRKTMITDIKIIFSNLRFFDMVLISVFAGFAEEFLFRGIVQTKFGIVAASILFGLVHFITPAYVIIAAIVGFYIGVLFHLYGSLLIPVQLHFVYDLSALLYLKYFVPTTTQH